MIMLDITNSVIQTKKMLKQIGVENPQLHISFNKNAFLELLIEKDVPNVAIKNAELNTGKMTCCGCTYSVSHCQAKQFKIMWDFNNE